MKNKTLEQKREEWIKAGRPRTMDIPKFDLKSLDQSDIDWAKEQARKLGIA